MKKIIYFVAAFMIFIFPAKAQVQERPSLITEELYAPRNHADLYKGRRYENQQSNEQLLWHKTLLSMGIENLVPSYERHYRDSCHYDTAIGILKDIRDELSQNTTYEKIWAENQELVFTACNRGNSTAPVMPQGESLPDRAQSDYKYQLASWHFYNRDYEEALALYAELSGNKGSAMRGLASYMVVRCLSRLGQKTEAYHKAESIVADQSLESVHDITANQRFILTYYRSGGDQIAEDHLRWLLSVVKIDPFSVKDIDQALSDYFDALDHLDKYFPLADNGGAVDWWLHDGVELKSARMMAVRKLAPEFELVDWMQASWAYNIFDQDWLWSLHDDQNSYWAENANIVRHAWNRYKNGDGLEWLGIAAQRIHPKDALAQEIMEEAEKYLVTDLDGETNEYKDWLQNLWQHTIRLKLGFEKYDEAVALASDQKFDYDLGRSKWNRRYMNLSQQVIPKAIRYLVYVGAFDQARTMLANTSERLSEHAGNHWQTLLARKSNDFLYLSERTRYAPDLWKAMVNTFSAEAQKALVEDDKLSMEDIKDELSLAALTQAMLLNKSDVNEYASIAGNENITIKPEILSAVENKEGYDYVEFMLRTPRMRPVPFPLDLSPYGRDKLEPTQIDLYNHNDNNWWCAYSPEKLSANIWNNARIVPRPGHSFNIVYNEVDVNAQERYEGNIRRLLEAHPYHRYTVAEEAKKLAAIPSGPQHLSQKVIAQEKWNKWKFWRGADARNESAANLHYAVKTTRYGCERNGSHATYSHGAFKLLHENYGDTIWAKQTPYWFSDKHF